MKTLPEIISLGDDNKGGRSRYFNIGLLINDNIA